MTTFATPSPDNLLLGRGALYFDLLVNGARTGENHFGNVTAFSVNTADETKEIYESMTHASGLYKSVTTKRTITCKMTGNELPPDNVMLQLQGTLGTITQVSGTLADQTLCASSKKGRFYSTGKRNISAVVVKMDATTYVEGTDYAVDPKSGRVQILAGGSIVDGSPLTFSCSYAAVTLKTVEGGNAATIELALRFVGDPTAGPAVEVEVYRTKVTPDGELGFISDEFGAWSLTGNVLMDPSRPAGESPYYRVIFL